MADNPKVGDYIALTWKNLKDSIWEATEGFVVGNFKDNKRSDYLLVDRSTYRDSLKSIFYSLGLMDLFLVNTSEIESIVPLELRERPPGIEETLRFKMEIDYKSNIDYEGTLRKLQSRKDCFVEPNQPAQTDGAANFSVKKITSIQEANISFSPLGNIQIHCLPTQLNQCLEWLKNNAEISSEHRHLVLIPTHFMLNVHDNFKEPSEPSEKLIDRLATIKQKEPIIFPLGWINHFFNDMDENALKILFPESDNIEKLVLNNKKKKESSVESKLAENNFLHINFGFSKSATSLRNPLSAEPPVLSMEGLIKKAEDENGLKNMWFRSRFDKYQTLNIGPHFRPNEKVLIRNLIINRELGKYKVNFRKYYGTDFETW